MARSTYRPWLHFHSSNLDFLLLDNPNWQVKGNRCSRAYILTVHNTWRRHTFFSLLSKHPLHDICLCLSHFRGSCCTLSSGCIFRKVCRMAWRVCFLRLRLRSLQERSFNTHTKKILSKLLSTTSARILISKILCHQHSRRHCWLC